MRRLGDSPLGTVAFEGTCRPVVVPCLMQFSVPCRGAPHEGGCVLAPSPEIDHPADVCEIISRPLGYVHFIQVLASFSFWSSNFRGLQSTFATFPGGAIAYVERTTTKQRAGGGVLPRNSQPTSQRRATILLDATRLQRHVWNLLLWTSDQGKQREGGTLVNAWDGV
jgi:hypothetical protein